MTEASYVTRTLEQMEQYDACCTFVYGVQYNAPKCSDSCQGAARVVGQIKV